MQGATRAWDISGTEGQPGQCMGAPRAAGSEGAWHSPRLWTGPKHGLFLKEPVMAVGRWDEMEGGRETTDPSPAGRWAAAPRTVAHKPVTMQSCSLGQ